MRTVQQVPDRLQRRVQCVDDELATGIERLPGGNQGGALVGHGSEMHQAVEREDDEPERAAGRAICLPHVPLEEGDPILDAGVCNRPLRAVEHRP